MSPEKMARTLTFLLDREANRDVMIEGMRAFLDKRAPTYVGR